MRTQPKPPEYLPTVKDAFSYVRFSSKKQADWASLERQLTGTMKWKNEFEMEVPSPGKINNVVVRKKAKCFSCSVKNVKATLYVENSNGNQDALATSIQNALNKRLVLFNGDANKPYMVCPDFAHGVSATAILGAMNFPEIHTDSPQPKTSPHRFHFKLTATVNPEDDNHSRFVTWKCELTGVDPLNAAESRSLSSAVQAAVNEHNNQWQISPGGTFELPALTFPVLAKHRAQEGFAEWAQNPAPGAVCNIN